jgi:hypothetical protein
MPPEGHATGLRSRWRAGLWLARLPQDQTLGLAAVERRHDEHHQGPRF